MSENKKDKQPKAQSEPQPQEVETVAAEPVSELEALQNEHAQLKDQYLRQLAEYDNFKKRTTREKQQIYTDVKADCVAGLLEVLDNFERAFAQKNVDDDFAKGIEMIYKQFLEYLNILGVTEIEAKGITFDPNVHNAVTQIEDETAQAGTVVEVFQKGYRIGDKVVRHAMVAVAK